MKQLLFKALGVFRVGALPPYNSSQSRLTIVTNILTIWGLVTISPMMGMLEQGGVDPSMYTPLYLSMGLICILAYFCNIMGWIRFARTLLVISLNLVGIQAALFYGKTFNGYWGAFVVAIAYTVFTMSREPRWLFWPLVGLCLSGLPIVDWLHFRGLIPITGLDSSSFPVSILWGDTLTFTLFLAIMLIIEKSFYDSYEDELKNLNENLENIVEKRTEMLVVAKEEAIEASLLKSQFVANTSHELRTPVQGLVGFVQMAQKRLQKQNSLTMEDAALREKVLKSLDSAGKSSDRLLDLIDTLLKITRAESRGFRSNPSQFHIKDVLERLIDQIRESFPHRNFLFDFENGSSGMVVTDSTLIQQVLENLINNAVRYSAENSDINVRLVVDERECHIHVVNQGPGVSDQDKDRIFDPFVQGTRTDDRTGGTGLGLFLCRKYAQALNGHIYLKDPSPEHTEFVFDFPRQLSKPSTETGSGDGPADRSPET